MGGWRSGRTETVAGGTLWWVEGKRWSGEGEVEERKMGGWMSGRTEMAAGGTLWWVEGKRRKEWLVEEWKNGDGCWRNTVVDGGEREEGMVGGGEERWVGGGEEEWRQLLEEIRLANLSSMHNHVFRNSDMKY